LKNILTKLSRRAIIRIASYLTALIVILGGFTWINYNRAAQYERYVNAQYQHAFDELVTSMSQIDSALQKGVYATSPQTAAALSAEIFAKSMTAQMSLGVMPNSEENLEQTAGFISRVGDYSYSLARSAAQGNGYTEEDRQNLRSLSDTASLLSQNLNSMQTDMQHGRLTITELKKAANIMDESENGTEIPETVGGSMRLIESEFPEVPSLIYDGPFSEHLTGVKPKVLENTEEVTQKQAAETAASFLELKASQMKPAGKSEGEIPAYYFSCEKGGHEYYITITVNGGKVMELLSSKRPERTRLTTENALKNAGIFLQRQGFMDMAESYYIIRDNIMTANFAYKQDEVICYTDLVKVSIDMETGGILGFEAKGYLMGHYDRDIPEPGVTTEQARTKISDDLEIVSSALALIPTEGKHEVFCYEFKCRSIDDEKNFIIYVNAVTGEQQKILILLEDDSGTLTI